MLYRITLPHVYFEFIVASIIFLIPFFRKIYFHQDYYLNLGNQKAKKNSGYILKSRDVFFDFVKGIAIIAVVVIHVTHIQRENFYHYNQYQFYFYVNNFFNNICRFTIPVFLICSGILLNPIKFSLKNIYIFYTRKVFRLLIPYVIICIFLKRNELSSEFFYDMISGKISTPFYYILVIFECYLIYPFLCLLKEKRFFLYLALSLSLYCFLDTDTWSLLSVPMVGKYLFPFIYGFYTREYFLNYKKNDSHFFFWFFIALTFNIFSICAKARFWNCTYFYGPAIIYLLFHYKETFQNSRKFYLEPVPKALLFDDSRCRLFVDSE
jgi:surface polysaccharide O-acyltransferase-like enzyme